MRNAKINIACVHNNIQKLLNQREQKIKKETYSKNKKAKK